MKQDKNKAKLMEENIKNYASEIKTLESFVEAVRLRPGMYIGSVGNKGFLSMIREIFQNSHDELMKESSPCDTIWVTYDERNHETTIEDNGRGIPHGHMIRIFMSQHTSSNFSKKPGEYSSGLHGVGSKVTNALSKYFMVESYILDQAKRIEFVEGFPTTKEEQTIKNEGKQGTKVTFVPTYDVMGEITLTAEEVLDMISKIQLLGKIGSVIHFTGTKRNGTVINKTLVNQDGILTFLIMKSQAPVTKPIFISHEAPERDKKLDIAFCYDSQNFSKDITAYSNFCPTVAGTHIDGFVDGVCKYFRDYMNKIYLGPKSKLTIKNADIESGLKAIVTVSHLNPIFDGQSKETLSNEDMKPFVRDTMIASLEQWAKVNPNDLQRICKYLKEIAEVRVKAEEGKVKLTTKYTASPLTNMPSKYEPATGKEHLELIIVEGDSAGGSAKNTRCKKRQGIIPIKGKISNALTTSKKKFLENPEVQTIITVIGGGYGKNFDLRKVKWEKFIFMTDADFDGYHIRSLLLKMVLVYMLPLLEDGRVYAAVPPLYGVNLGTEENKNFKYFTDKLDFIKYNEKYFSQQYEIYNMCNKKLSNEEIIDLLYRNVDYVDDLKRIANKYSLDYLLLELVCANIDQPLSKLGQIVRKQFRFMDIEKLNNIPVIKGMVNCKSQLIILNDAFMYDIKNIIENIKKNREIKFIINGQQYTLYQLMDLYKNTEPKNITRYKGLGEMDSLQLKESTLHPDANRTLIRYTVEDAVAEINKIKYLEDNKYELIKDIKVDKRELL